jgi:hypothetical protein
MSHLSPSSVPVSPGNSTLEMAIKRSFGSNSYLPTMCQQIRASQLGCCQPGLDNLISGGEAKPV